MNTNVTAPNILSGPAPEPTLPPDEQFAPPEGDPCSTELCWPVNFIPDLPTATGWEDDNFIAGPTGLVVPDEPEIVVTIRTPTILDIQTGIAPATKLPVPTKAATGNEQSGQGFNDNVHSAQLPPQVQAQPTGPKAGNARPGTPVATDEQPQENDLLFEIISRMGEVQVFVAPTNAPDGGQHVNTQKERLSGITDAAPEQTALAIGASITIGSAVVTLTAGLSTTVGDGTVIGITTDGTGQTIITIASSGTAVTAVVSDAPATMTVPRNGFQASITAAARPGSSVKAGPSGEVSSSSSKAGATGNTIELGWWTRALLSLLGAGVLL